MSVKLGMFTMPFHHPDRDYASILAEDQEAVILADQLGFSEAYVGEHFSFWSARITSPLIFLATVISRTRQIRLGTGVLNLPQTHPATVAAHAAQLHPLSLRRARRRGHRAGRAGQRPRDVRGGAGRAAAPDGAGVHRHRAQALGPGPALRDRRALLEVRAQERRGARVQGGLYPAAAAAAAPAHRAVHHHAQFLERQAGGGARAGPQPPPPPRPPPRPRAFHPPPQSLGPQAGGGARLDPHLRQLLPPPLSAGPLGEIPRG